jgi:hypothetical protein
MDEPHLKKTVAAMARMKRLQGTAGLFRFSSAQFLIAMVLLLAAYPFVIDLKYGADVETALMTLLLISAVLAVSGRTWGLAILLVIPAVVGPWIDRYYPGLVPMWVKPTARMTFVGFVVVQLLRFVARARRVSSEVLCAGISGYLLLGLFWTSAYLLDSQVNPSSFSGGQPVQANPGLGQFDALYFSYVSLTCLGSNGIVPVSKVARMLMVMESLAGVLYLAVLIARLVALYSLEAANEPDDKK